WTGVDPGASGWIVQSIGRRPRALGGQVSARRRAVLVAAPAALAIVLVPLRDHVSAANLALILVLAVLGSAVGGGVVVGAVGRTAAAAAFDFSLTPPYGSFAIHRGDDIVTTILMGVVGISGGVLIERTRRSEAEAAARRAEVTRFHRRAEMAAGGEPPWRLIAIAADELAALLDVVDIGYERGAAPAHMAVLTHWGA